MEVTKELIAQKLVAYLEGTIQRSELVDWAENAIREGDFVNDALHRNRDIVPVLVWPTQKHLAWNGETMKPCLENSATKLA